MALSNRRLLKCEPGPDGLGRVTFTYRKKGSRRERAMTVTQDARAINTGTGQLEVRPFFLVRPIVSPHVFFDGRYVGIGECLRVAEDHSDGESHLRRPGRDRRSGVAY